MFGFGLTALAAAVIVTVVIVNRVGGEDLDAAPPSLMQIVLVRSESDSVVRVVTEEGGCRRPIAARVRMQADVVQVGVLGWHPGGGCTAVIKVACSRVTLPAKLGRRKLGGRPISAHGNRRQARQVMATSRCVRIPVQAP